MYTNSMGLCELPESMETSSRNNEIEKFKWKEGPPSLLFVFVIQMVASAMDVESTAMTKHARGNAKLSRARQISMYLMNVSLAASYSEIAKVFERDRTTVSYACRVVEELRDVPAFDDRLNELESILSTVLQMLPNGRSCNI